MGMSVQNSALGGEEGVIAPQTIPAPLQELLEGRTAPRGWELVVELVDADI